MDDDSLPPLVRLKGWKVSIVGLAVEAVAVAAFIPGLLERLPVAVQLTGITIALVVLVAACSSVRCPSCRLRLVQHAMSKRTVHEWLSWLLAVRACPRCGYHRSPRG